ncbi:type I polyketide synthase [Actinocrinis sp.]|uniref:type I polyketide synthase n=1 Tax=Actinocrinis sp. TaxID=1920516 RepID=UPI0039C886DB
MTQDSVTQNTVAQDGRLHEAEQTVRRQNATIRRLLLEKYEPIAVVGIGLRFPGGSGDPDQFADFLREGRSGIRPVPQDRWDVPAFTAGPHDEDDRGKIRTPLGGYLDRVDLFDAQFFNVSPKEAQYTDPQQRLLLETSWEALEHANIDPTPLRRGSGGVYVGASSIDYALELDSLPYRELDGHLAAGITFFPLSGRISYFLGWRGPCLTVDTACASSLTALHQAVTGLRRGECDIALAAGVNALHHPRIPVIFSQANMLAPDGQCKTFDESADGYVRAEGCAVLVLKRLSDAQRDGDTVHAVVRGTAVGQDGDSAGLTVPNGTAQTAVMRAALDAAALKASDIQYVEAHGTGTPLGDPIEMGAISDVFEHSHTKDAPLVVGSVKTNLGHMEPVAGLVGIIKTILQMREDSVFPHLNYTTPSSRIPWDSYPVVVPTGLRPWTAPVKRALVNSFGFGGTIAAAVIEQPPNAPVPAGPSGARPDNLQAPDSTSVFTLSAKNKRALRGQIERYRNYLTQRPDTPVEELCQTANTGRAHFNLRVAGVVRDREELAALLDRQLATVDEVASAEPRKVAFLFTGQGSQYPGMAASAYRRFATVREHVDECDRLFAPLLGRSIAGMLLDAGPHSRDIDQTRFTQPALFTLEYALAQLWISWGVRPSALIGHSIGEVVAATVAGLFSLPDAVKLVAARARLMQSVSTPGGMVAVNAPAAQISPLLEGLPTLAIAAINSPGQCVISGADTELAQVLPVLEERGLRAKRLPVSHAFHSPLMTEVFDEFRAELAGIRFGEPTITLVSNLTGKVARPAQLADPEYWIRHIGEPVDFEAGMRALERRGKHFFLEVGPSTALSSLARQCVNAADHLWAASLTPKDPEGVTILRSLAQGYAAGVPINWSGVHRGRPRAKTALPTYAFDRKRYWLPQPGGRPGATSAATGPARHPLLGEEITDARLRAEGGREFRARISAAQPAYLTDHRVSGRPVFPGTGYLEILLALQDALHGQTGHPIRDVRIREALFLGEDTLTEVFTRTRTEADGTTSVEIVSRVADKADKDSDKAADNAESGSRLIERVHATAVIDTATTPADLLTDVGRTLRTLADEAGEPDSSLSTNEIYAEFTAVGMEYGPEFQRLGRVGRYRANLAIGELRGLDTALAEFLPPAVADAALHPLAAVVDDDGDNYLPVRFGWFRLHRKPKSDTLRSILRLAAPDPRDQDAGEVDLRADLVLLDGERPVFELRGLGLKRVADGSRRAFFHRQRWLKRSLPAQQARRERHVLILGRTADELAALAAHAPEARTELLFAADLEHAGRLLRERQITDVAWFWRGAGDPADVAALRADCETNYRDLLATLRVLDESGFGHDQRLWLLTERAQWLPGDLPDRGEDLAAATVWGFGHVLLNEYPSYRATMVDLPGALTGEAGGDAIGPLLDEWQGRDSAEFQVAFRKGLRHVRRLLPYDPAAVQQDANAGLRIREYGQFSGIELAPAEDRAPQGDGPQGDEIQVRVEAAGLNFKDVLNALGMMKQAAQEAGVPYEPQPLGFECAGTVIAAGPRAEFAPGDDVVVNALDVMKRRITVPSAAAARKPAGIGFAEAAGLGSAYVTAYYALHTLARIQPGDRILIHAAAGGVGQAAVQLAKLAGARVYATASPHKWPLLHAQGVRHVMNSRTLDFADQISELTGGEGVDIVLNSLNKDYIAAGLRCLARGGRFVELGKVGVWSPERVQAVRPDVAYHNFDLSELPEQRAAALNKEILRTVADRIAAGDLAPLPTTVYTLDEIEEAFGVLSRGANLGKLVFDFADRGDQPQSTDAAPTVRADRTYLITGGLGAFGLMTAHKLVDLGARHLVLLSRGGQPADDARHLHERLLRRAAVTVYRGDIGDPGDMARIAEQLAQAPHPVGGIVHAAGALADAPISAQSWESINGLFQAKVYGSWLLDRMADGFPQLDFFLAHSSAAAVVGGASQSNYAAANAYLDAVLQRRIRRGRHALSFNWGALSQAGMSARLSDRHIKALEHEGIRYFSPNRAMRALARAFDGPPAQLVAGECDWDRFTAAKPVANALYRELVRGGGAGDEGIDPARLLEQSKEERIEAIERFVRAKVASVLHLDDIDDVNPGAEFVQLGLDSLVAVELKNGLEATFRVPLPTSLAFDYPSARVLTAFLDSKLTSAA